jgi:N-methylhydantoinase A
VEETILGIRSVVNANMLRGIRRTTVEKGIDVRDCTLLAFGGAGPIHAADLARELGMKEVVVPPMAGMFSALGILLSDVRLDFGETLITEWNSETHKGVDEILQRFRTEALRSLDRQGLSRKKACMSPTLDMRFKGQSFHLSVPYSTEADMKDRFHKAFRKRYGYDLPGDNAVQVVTVRLSAVAAREKVPLPIMAADGKQTRPGKRALLLPSGWETVPVFSRGCLNASFHGHGPLVVED